MPKSVVRYRNIGIKGPGDLALRSVAWPLDLGAGRLWFTKKPRGLHLAIKRWLIAGPLRLHSFYLPGNGVAASGSAAGGRSGAPRWHQATTIQSLAQPINHGGTAFTVGRVNR